MSLPQNYLHTIFEQHHKMRSLNAKQKATLTVSLLVFLAISCFIPQLFIARAAVRQYGLAKTSAAIVQAQIQRGKVMLTRASGGTLFAGAKALAPNVTLTKTLVPSSPTAIPTGRTFTYRLGWRCAGSVSPADDCNNMVVSDVLPPNMEFVPPPTFASPVTSITTSGSNPQTVNIAFTPIVTAGSTGEVEISVRYIPGSTPNGLTSINTATITADVTGGGTVSNNSNPVTTTSVATNKVSTEKVLVYGGAAGDLSAYDINVCNDPGSTPEGYLAFGSVTVSDPLPANAQFVSASPAPDSAPAVGANGTITWNFPTGFAEPCRTFRVVVRYPSANFSVGNTVTNTADVIGTLVDGTPINDPAPGPITLAAPGPDSNINKTAASSDKSAPDQVVGGRRIERPVDGDADTGLIPDPYFVQVDPSNFAPSGALYGCASSNPTVAGNSDLNEQDHGASNSDPFNYPPISSVVNLVAFNEPGNTDGDDTNGNLTVDFGFVTVAISAIDDMGMCVGPGATLTLTTKVTNPGTTAQANNLGPEFAATFPAGIVGVPGRGITNGGGTITVTNTGVTWDGTIPANGMVTLSYRVQVGNSVQAGTNLCITSTVYADGDNNGTNEGAMNTQACHVVNCPPVGPGEIPSGGSGSSVLIFPLYSSSAANPADNNTRVRITNYHPAKAVSLHLFYVDGASCTVAVAALCLTAQQTSSFLMSDLDPGTTGYLTAVAVDSAGCPINFNFLGGDEFVKFESGHRGNLDAYGVPAIAGGLAACDANTNNVALNFDGVSYGRLPRTVAVSNIASPDDGNSMMLFVNRIGGNLSSGADKLGSIFGLLYDDAEKAYSFSITPNTCQFRNELSGSFPRTAPRLTGHHSVGPFRLDEALCAR